MGVILIRNYPDTADAMCQIYHAWHMAILITKHFHDFVQKILNTFTRLLIHKCSWMVYTITHFII